MLVNYEYHLTFSLRAGSSALRKKKKGRKRGETLLPHHEVQKDPAKSLLAGYLTFFLVDHIQLSLFGCLSDKRD